MAAGIINKKEIEMFEAQLKRQLFCLPYDIKSKVIINITTSQQKDTADVI